MPDVSIRSTTVVAAPKDYTLQGSQELTLKAVRAAFDGTAAAGQFLPALQMLDPNGNVMWTAVPNTATAAGGSVDASWFPLVREQAAAGTPNNPLGTLWAWYDFSDTTTTSLDGSGRIQAITDKSGNGHDLVQTTAANRPTPDTLGGLPAALCNRTHPDYLLGGPWSDPLPQPFTVCTVYSQSVGPTANYYPGAVGTTNVLDPGLLVQNDFGGNIFLQNLATTIRDAASSSPFTQYQISGIVDGGSSSLRINGASDPGTLNGTPQNELVLGAAHVPEVPGTTSGLNGRLGEILFYQTHLSATQLAAVEAYLKAKWSTP